MEDKDMVALVWLSNLLLPLIVPIIVMFILKDKSEFHRKHFNYLLNLLIIDVVIFTILLVLTIIIGVVTFGIGALLISPLFIILVIYNLVITILAAIKAHEGKDDVPFVPLLIQL